MSKQRLLLAFLSAAVIAACTHTAPSQPSPGSRPGAPAPGAAPAPPPEAPAQAAPRRRVPPNPVVQDSIRRATVDSILKTIAGRENEPAGKVFKNVKFLATMTAGEFLKTMDTNYGRGLGWTCSNCHAAGSFDADTRKNKRIARQMQVMTDRLNRNELTAVKELDAEYEKVSCVMCHRGTNEPKSTMPVPPPPVAPSRP